MQIASTYTTQQLVPKTGYGILQFNFCFTPKYSISTSSTYGMVMPGRSISSASYRYGFNGMEKNDEVKEDGNSYTTEFRQYDPRIGRWLSIDPLFNLFPKQSPYVSMDNNPILFKDPNGDSTWVNETSKTIEINTTIEFSGRGLYNKKGELRKNAVANIENIKKDIKDKWDNTEYEGKEVKINLITKTSENGGTNESYDQINVEKGSGRSKVQIKDKNQTLITNKNQIEIIKSIRSGTNYYRVSGTFYLNTKTGTYAHEYGHMIGYWDEDYTRESAGPFDHGSSPKFEYQRGGIMYHPYGVPLKHHFQRIFQVNPPK